MRLALSNFSCLGVEADEELVGEGDADHLWRLSGSSQPLLESDEVGFVATHHAGHDEQDFADRGAASAHTALALMLARVRGQRSNSGQLGNGLVGEGADLGHFGHEAGDGAVGHALDGAEGLVEFAPQRVGVDQRSDLLFQTRGSGWR